MKVVTGGTQSRVSESITAQYKRELVEALASVAANPYEQPIAYTSKDELDRLLKYCVAIGASDLTIKTGLPPKVEVHGRTRTLGNKRLSREDMIHMAQVGYGANAIALLNQAQDLDLAYHLKIDRRLGVRFRLNITPVLYGYEGGFEMVFRTLGMLPDTLEEQGVDPDLRSLMIQPDGLVLVTGPTGHGKTTLLGGLIRELVDSERFDGKIVTYEAPIEFTFDTLGGDGSYVSQTSIPDQLPSFGAGVRNALRRKPSHIMVQEIRDHETLSAISEAALTGHPVSATTHSTRVSVTPSRLVKLLGPEASSSGIVDLIGSLRVIVTQNLLPTLDGRRRAVREYMHFDEDTRLELMSMDPEKWNSALPHMLKERGRPMIRDVEDLFHQGLISEMTYRKYDQVSQKELA